MTHGDVKDWSAAAADDVRPKMRLPPSGPPSAVIAVVFVGLALGFFGLLEGRRRQAESSPLSIRSSQTSEALLPAPPPPLEIPPAPPMTTPVPPPLPAAPPIPPQPRIRYIEPQAPPRPPPFIPYVAPAAMLRPPAPGPVARLSEPALVVDLAAAANAQAEQQETERITVLRRRASVIPQGTLIPAVLETPIDSPSSGPVRAITSTDTRGFDGMRVLIPRGSRLIGDYRGDSQAGQDRLLVTWTRLIRPDGISVRLTSAATDPAGGAGIPGVVNEHLLGRFANVALQTAINVGVDLASRSGNGSVIINGPGQALGGVGETLVPSATLKPTIRVRAGAQINVFVARDLDFSGALPRP